MSTLKVDNLQTTAGVSKYLASAWVNFNGTGTVAIRAAGNVSSITDNAVGDYTTVFSTNMIDANYAVTAAGSESGAGSGGQSLITVDATRTVSSVQYYWKQGNLSAPVDTPAVYMAVIR